MPTKKVQAGAAAGALAAIVVWSIKQWGHVEVPAEIGIALSAFFTFIVQYIVPDSAGDAS